jgi:hypothetical protein
MSDINENRLSVLSRIKNFPGYDNRDEIHVSDRTDDEEQKSECNDRDDKESKLYKAMDLLEKGVQGIHQSDTLYKAKRIGVSIKSGIRTSATTTGKATSTAVGKNPSATRGLLILTGAGLSSTVPVGAALIGVYMCSKGALDIKELLVNDDIERGLQGVRDIDTGVRSGFIFAETSKTFSKTAAAALTSPAATGLLTGLGVLHGAAEAGTGVLNIKEGLETQNKNKILTGALEVGLGAGIAVSSVFCPLPVSVALAVISATKAGIENKDTIEKKIEDFLEKTGIGEKEKEKNADFIEIPVICESECEDDNKDKSSAEKTEAKKYNMKQI